MAYLFCVHKLATKTLILTKSHKRHQRRKTEKEREKREREKLQKSLVGISHLLIQPLLVNAAGHGIRGLHFRGIIKGEINVVDGAAAVRHGDGTGAGGGEVAERILARRGTKGRDAAKEGVGERHL